MIQVISCNQRAVSPGAQIQFGVLCHTPKQLITSNIMCVYVTCKHMVCYSKAKEYFHDGNGYVKSDLSACTEFSELKK